MYTRARNKSTRKPTSKLRGARRVLERIKRVAPKLNAFLKNTKLISRIGDAGINYVPGQYRGLADGALAGIKSMGYGDAAGPRSSNDRRRTPSSREPLLLDRHRGRHA